MCSIGFNFFCPRFCLGDSFTSLHVFKMIYILRYLCTIKFIHFNIDGHFDDFQFCKLLGKMWPCGPFPHFYQWQFGVESLYFWSVTCMSQWTRLNQILFLLLNDQLSCSTQSIILIISTSISMLELVHICTMLIFILLFSLFSSTSAHSYSYIWFHGFTVQTFR